MGASRFWQHAFRPPPYLAEAHAVLAPVLDGFAATPEFPEIEQACGNVRLSVWSEFHRADLDPF